MEKRVEPGSIRNKNGSVSIWRVPNYLLEARGSFLGDRDEFIGKLAKLRSIAALVILADVAISYPRYAKSLPNQVTATRNTPAGLETAANYAATWLSSLLEAIGISILCVAIFMVVVVLLARPRVRITMLRQLCLAPIACGFFIGIVILAGGTISLLNTKVSAWAKHQSTAIHYGTVAAVFIVSLILAVWAFKAIYLVAVDVFRADDAHPLLAPVVTTFVSWALAFVALRGGGPADVPRDIGLWMVFLGPTTITIINVWACTRLWREHHALLFRQGRP